MEGTSEEPSKRGKIALIPVRRKDKEIRDLRETEEILRKALVCRIALCEGDRPYCVPMIYCYDRGVMYLHSAKEGKKLEVLRKNNRICFEVEVDVEVVTEGKPCSWTFRYRSVVGRGKAYIVEDSNEKRKALECMVERVSPGYRYRFTDEELESVVVIRIEVEELSGKVSE